ncbi:MAG: hypothetical protein B7X11_02800 [Acidobacteria bacterium 37-65-4]|nr:MAG: hypothetical protein B7X11_02800 [Acidobacteria bacterium 37-65-4]
MGCPQGVRGEGGSPGPAGLPAQARTRGGERRRLAPGRRTGRGGLPVGAPGASVARGDPLLALEPGGRPTRGASSREERASFDPAPPLVGHEGVRPQRCGHRQD